MNAKQTEELTGISRRNLRFYEEQGLICPKRNPKNDYRDYSETDIETLRLIRALRMLDTPLEEIAAYLRNEMTMTQLSEKQEERLRQRKREVEISLHFCKELKNTEKINLEYIDKLLCQMDRQDVKTKLFDDWKNDYRKVVHVELKKMFSFTPDDLISTPEEFTNALCKYGNENDLPLVITKEGLEPEFEIDGIAYTAQRIYRRVGPVPMAVVRCVAQNPERLEADVLGIKGKLMKLFHKDWILLVLLLILGLGIIRANPAERLEVLLLGGALIAITVSLGMVFRNYRN